MASKLNDSRHGSVAAWAKRCYFAGRAVMEAALRPHELGATQWCVHYRLAHDGPTRQRELLRRLRVERATLSVVVGELVRKGLIEQVADRADARRKLLRMTGAGAALWDRLPNLETLIHKAAFAGIADADIAVAVRVLRTATERLNALSLKGTDE